MFWIFAAVVLILMVLHPGFRKVAFWIAGAGAALGVVVAIVALSPSNAPRTPIAQTPAAVPFDPDAYLAQNMKDPDAAAVSCEMAKKANDSRTAFFACGAK